MQLPEPRCPQPVDSGDCHYIGHRVLDDGVTILVYLSCPVHGVEPLSVYPDPRLAVDGA